MMSYQQEIVEGYFFWHTLYVWIFWC